jgi:two-component system cell cycle response regulator DivK
VPILAITANVMKGDRERTLAAGCDGYIQKPIDVDRLPEQVRAMLRRNHT